MNKIYPYIRNVLTLSCFLYISGCSMTEIPEGFYGCLDVEGMLTDSQGRLIKIPDNTELTPELIASICL